MIQPSLKQAGWKFMWSGGIVAQTLQTNDDGVYSLKISKHGCEYEDETILVQYPAITIPNVITPNGDKKNDLFIIDASDTPVVLSIYNRWGEVLFSTNDYQNDWPALEVSSGVYYFRLNDQCRNELYNGWLQVLHD